MMTSVASSSQTHDNAGNLTHTAAIYGGSTAYTLIYDHHNRLTEVKDNAGTTRLAKFTWDALGRRIEYIDDTNSETKRYYFDGVNEVYEYNDSGDPLRYFVHGVSYIDERLAMVNCYETTGTSDDRPYYYVLDRMYNVRFLVDRAGAIIERYAYDPYGKPLIRESGGRGDTTDLGRVTAADNTRYGPSVAGTIWEPRCDMDDDGDVDSNDTTPYNYAVTVTWPANPTVSQAFSDVGNPYMFQGVPHFAIDTSSSATTVKFPLNHHRARFAEPITGRWVTRDPLNYNSGILSFWHSVVLIPETNLFRLMGDQPCRHKDPSGTTFCNDSDSIVWIYTSEQGWIGLYPGGCYNDDVDGVGICNTKPVIDSLTNPPPYPKGVDTIKITDCWTGRIDSNGNLILTWNPNGGNNLFRRCCCAFGGCATITQNTMGGPVNGATTFGTPPPPCISEPLP